MMVVEFVVFIVLFCGVVLIVLSFFDVYWVKNVVLVDLIFIGWIIVLSYLFLIDVIDIFFVMFLGSWVFEIVMELLGVFSVVVS